MTLNFEEFPALYDSKIIGAIINSHVLPYYIFTFIDKFGFDSCWRNDLYTALFNDVYNRNTKAQRVSLYRVGGTTGRRLMSR